MTPNIRHGYTIRDIFEVTDELNAKLPSIRTELMAGQLLDVVHRFLDGQDDQYKRETGILLFDAMKAWEQEQQQYTEEQRSHDPIEFHMDFLRADDGTLLAAGHVNYAGDDYVEVLNTMETLTPYDVVPDWLDQNNPDHAEELAIRKHRWASAVGEFRYGASRPEYRLPHTRQPMMVFGEDRDAMLEAMLCQQRTPEERLRLRLVDTTLTKILHGVQDEDQEDMFAAGFSRINEYIRHIEHVLRTDDVTRYGVLPPLLTLTDLIEKSTPQTDFQLDMARVDDLAHQIRNEVDE